MKKLITILAVMMVLVGAVFAAGGDQLVVKATVDKVAPVFKIYGSTSKPVDNTIYGTNPLDESKSTIAVDTDPATQGVTVYVRLAQYGKAKYYNTALSVAIKPTALYLNGTTTDTDDTHVSGLPTVTSTNTASSVIKGTTSTDADAIKNLVPSIASSVATYSLNYTGIAVGASDTAETNIDTLTMAWAAKDSLVPGTYKAYITLEYTAN